MSFTLIKNYDTPSELTYDAGKIAITTDADLLVKTYANETFFADYSATVNGRRGLGSLVGTASGGAAIAGGYLNLKGATNKYVSYVATDNFSVLIQTGCVRFNFKPNYSGTPAADQFMAMATQALAAVNNMIEIKHATGTGQLNVLFRGPSGATLNMPFGVWNPTAGTEYDIEFNFDLTTGASRMFVDGTQFGTTNPGTMARTDTIAVALVGADFNAAGSPDFEIRNLEVFSTVQHTAAFTPSTDFSTYAAEADVIPNTFVGLSAIASLTINETIPANTAITYYIKWDGFYYYWDGAAWSISDRSVAQSNTKADLLANILSFDVSAGDEFTVGAILQSIDGYATPTLTSWTLKYTFSNVAEVVSKCLVHFELYDSSGQPLQGAEVRFDIEDFWYGEALISAAVTAKTDVEGKGQVEVVETATHGVTADIIISHKSMPPLKYDGRTIPNKEVEALSVIVA